MSGALILAVAAVVVGATGAFFSDSETSTANLFTAGAIDLQVDNNSWYNGVFNAATSWTLTDLTVEKFFNFVDVKPGDHGEDAISLHVTDNPAYACATVTLTSDDEVVANEPELDAGDVADTGDLFDGELGDEVNFIWWADDGDSVLESGEVVLPGGPLGALGSGGTATVALADSTTNLWTGSAGPLNPLQTYYLAKAWCFGSIGTNPVPGNGGVSPAVNSGVTCDGAPVTNISQTDTLTADVGFTVTQARNNDSFVCVTP